MSKLFKKVTVIAVALTVLMSLVVFQSGCGKKDNEQAGNQTSTSTASTQTVQVETTKIEQPVELTILNASIESGSQQGVQNDPIANEITKQTGVIMNLIPANAVGDINAKIAALIATGDLPDITYFPSLDLMQNALGAKALLPLDDYLDKFGQNLLKNTSQMLETSRASSFDNNQQVDGKLYFLRNPVGIFSYDPLKSQVAPYIRWDLYKKLGYPKIDSIDDYIPILQKMMELEPTNAEGKKNYGVAAWFGEAQWWCDWNIWATIPGMYGDTVGQHTDIHNLADKNYQLWLTDTNSNYYRSLKWWNKAYRAKILDPDSFTIKYDSLQEKVKAGRIFMGFASWEFDIINKDYISKGITDKFYVQMPPPKDSTAYWITNDQPDGTSTNGYAVSKNCKNPEKAVQFIDFLASYDGVRLINNGIEGQTWDEVDGKAVLKKETIDQYNSDPEYALKSGVGKYSNMTVLSYMNTDPKYNCILKFFYQPEVLNLRLSPVEKEACDYFGVKTPMELITKNIKTTIGEYYAWPPIPPVPEDLQEVPNRVDKYVFDNYIKMILAKSDEEFTAIQAKFMEGVISLGYEKYHKWRQEELDKALASQK